MHVDAATIDDVPRMAELLGMLFTQEAEFAPDRAAQERGLRMIDDFVVDPAYRGQGGGSMLLAAAIETARQAGCLRITLNTDQDNAAAQRLYQRHGFELSTMKSMRLRL
jgi:ribosomal protein S18 acetylase RimI-like enzyme